MNPNSSKALEGANKIGQAKKGLEEIKNLRGFFQNWKKIRKYKKILKPGYRKGKLLMAVIFSLDLLTFIIGFFIGPGEVIDEIVDACEAIILPFIYKLLRLKIPWLNYLFLGILELIPFVNMLPIWTVQASITLYYTWLPQAKAEEQRIRDQEAARMAGARQRALQAAWTETETGRTEEGQTNSQFEEKRPENSTQTRNDSNIHSTDSKAGNFNVRAEAPAENVLDLKQK